MNRILFFSGLTMVCILLSGCPYESNVPIDDPSVKINPKIIGTWEDQESHLIYKVSRKDNFTYDIEGKDEKDEHLTAYNSVINGVIFLNLFDGKPDTVKKYSFFKIEMHGDNVIKAFPVTENIREQFTSKRDFKKFITANMKNSYFFEKEGTLMRKENVK
ncbi:MAG: hypothetical protein ABJA57_10015 [Ginsengibacter sp.]